MWHSKQLSEIAGVSVRTLHHYDKIGLLTPSARGDNNYRLYSEADLSRLQQILSLKFFGFDLKKIAYFLAGDHSLLDVLEKQATFLEQKISALNETKTVLNQSICAIKNDESLSWKKTIELIEVFNMMKTLQDSWVKAVFTERELQQYSEFEQALLKQHGKQAMQQFEEEWHQLIQEMNQKLNYAPDSEVGMNIAAKVIDWLNARYGYDHAHLRTKLFEKGFGEGQGFAESGLTEETVAWLEKAFDAHIKKCIMMILDKIGEHEATVLVQEWDALMLTLYGHDNHRKDLLKQRVIKELNISDDARVWLMSMDN